MRATGLNIADLRQARGLTVTDVQTYMGFDTPRSVYKWEEGQSLPSLDNLIILSLILQVPMDDIIIWTHLPPQSCIGPAAKRISIQRIRNGGQV